MTHLFLPLYENHLSFVWIEKLAWTDNNHDMLPVRKALGLILFLLDYGMHFFHHSINQIKLYVKINALSILAQYEIIVFEIICLIVSKILTSLSLLPETINHDKKLAPMMKTKIGFSFDKWDVILGFFSELNELFDECLGHGCIIW